MNRTRPLRILTHWRTWWDLTSVTFVVWSSVVLVGASIPPFLQSVFPLGLPISIGLFFAGFACLLRRQRTGDEEPRPRLRGDQ